MYRIFLFSAFILASAACGRDEKSVPENVPPSYASRPNPSFEDDKCTPYNEADPDGDGPKEAPLENIPDGATELCKTLSSGKVVRFKVDNHAGCLLQTMKEMDFLPCL